jgi:hypothetical protein
MSLNSPKFTKINESFFCKNCGFEVPISQQSCRDHCPKCLYSLHVDNNPGDRQADCKGMLKPIAWSYNRKKGYLIHYQCQKCGMKKVNRFLEIDAFEADSLDALLKLNSVTTNGT